MNLADSIRAVSFTSPSVPLEQLEGVDQAIADYARNGQSITLPGLSTLPEELGAAISEFLATVKEVELYDRDSRNVPQVERERGRRAVRVVSHVAWVKVLTVLRDNRAEYAAEALEQRAATAKRLREAAAELNVAAHAYVVSVALERVFATGIPNTHRLSASDPTHLAFRGPLQGALGSTVGAGAPTEGLAYAMTLLTD